MVFFIVFLSLLGSLAASAESASSNQGGLQTSVAVDILGTATLTKGASSPKNRLDVREAEFMLFAPIDHLFDGVLSFAAHYEEGKAFAELHEAHLGSSRLIPRSRFRLGQFYLSVGRLNQVHRHDWPFISAPKVQTEFFDDHGVLDQGIEYSYLLPTSIYLDLTAGITNGWTFGHSHDEGTQPLFPTHYMRLVTYQKLGERGGTQVGLNYLGRRKANGVWTTLLGVDGIAKWREDKIIYLLLQSEFWCRVEASDTDAGVYLYPQIHLFSDVYAGMRLDYFSRFNAKDGFGARVNNFVGALVPTIGVKPSEFSNVRLAYTFQNDYQEGRATETSHVIELQAVFILGAHPAHDF